MKRQSKGVGIALISCLVVSVLAYFYVDAMLDSETITEPVQEFSLPHQEKFGFNLDTTKGMLVEAMVDPSVKLTVANQSPVGLLDDVVGIEEVLIDQPELDLLHDQTSAKSYAQAKRLIAADTLTDFAWYIEDGQELLYYGDAPYTGWYQLMDSENTMIDCSYYIDGQSQVAHHLLPLTVQQLLQTQQMMASLMPTFNYLPIYMTQEVTHDVVIDDQKVDYAIMHYSSEDLIWSRPAGMSQARLVATTQDYGQMPMEITREVTTPTGTWLKASIGYEPLGWIREDLTGARYSLTSYSERELLDLVAEVIEEHFSWIHAKIGASFVHNETMAQVSVDNQIFFPASTQKIYALAEVYHQYKFGLLDPYDVMTLEDADKVPGAGIIQGYPTGSQFYLDELVDLVATYSDNTAANMLMEIVGGGDVMTPHMHQIGLYDTYVYGLYYHGLGDYFYTTPADAARLFALMYNDRLNGDPYDTWLIEKLMLNTHTHLRSYIPYTTSSWNKSGEGETERNDVATFVTPYGSYSLAVYTAEPAYYHQIPDDVGRLSAAVHEVFVDYQLNH